MRSRPAVLFVLGVLGALLLAEACLQLLPVSTATMRGYHHDADVLTYPTHHHWRVATGWDLRNTQTLQSNNWGFVADHDFVPDPRAVALIGDSYVEASMLAAPDRPAAQLERLLHSRRPVYAMGSAGTSLLDYAQRIRMAAQHFGVRDMVLIVERFDARQSLCGSGNVQTQCLDPLTLQRRTRHEPPPGWLKSLARHSALAQYLSGQIRVQPQAIAKAMFTRTTPGEKGNPAIAQAAARHGPEPAAVAQMQRMVDAVVRTFFADVRPYLKGQLIAVVDGRRGRTDGTDGPADLADLERAYLMQRLRAGGAVVDDLAPLYAEHARWSRRLLDVGPYDGHLNALGVRIAMTAAAASLAAPVRP